MSQILVAGTVSFEGLASSNIADFISVSVIASILVVFLVDLSSFLILVINTVVYMVDSLNGSYILIDCC